jgi:hypothetical protein
MSASSNAIAKIEHSNASHSSHNNNDDNNNNNNDNNNNESGDVDDENDESDLLLDDSTVTTQGFGDGFGQSENSEEDSLTLEQIILWSTHERQNNDLMDILLLTHKTFTDSLTLLKLLHRRFFLPIPNDMLGDYDRTKQFQVTIQKRIQLKVIKAVRGWMKQYFATEFLGDDAMLNEMRSWLKEMREYSNSREVQDYCSWVLPLYDTVKKEFQRFQQKGHECARRAYAQPLKNFDHVVIPKKINIAQLSAEMLADQLTLMAFRVFSRITDRELLEQEWKSENKAKATAGAPNVMAMIKLFNSLTVFVQIQILREKNLMKRAKAMKRVIKMGERFRELRNFNSLCAVFGALNSAAIHRLKLAWKRVPEKSMQQFEEWAMIFCCNRNHRNLRQMIRKFPGRPCIPHLGVVLQDIIFIDEGNASYMEDNIFSPKEANINGKKGGKGKGKGKAKMINFSKCVRIADRIKILEMHQMQAFHLKENEIVQKVLLKEFAAVQHVNEDEIWDMSTEIHRTDQREHKSGGIFNVGR